MKRIFLSAPHISGRERELVDEAFDTNWVGLLGPQVTAFEKEMCAKTGARNAVALSSGTGGLHLALILLGVGRGEEVWCSSLTFAASSNPITYVGARPAFVDSDESSWNMDPDLLEDALVCANRENRLPRAVIAVDLYGQCADYDRILSVCNRYEIPVIEDAAEALGATYKGRSAGTFGAFGVFSFNGNKIITSSGGGMLLTSKKQWAEDAFHLATQARDPAPHYQHSKIGYNYRMSNVSAAIGRGQLETLDEKVESRRSNFEFYQEHLGNIEGIEFMPEAPYGQCTRWLTCLTVDPRRVGVSREQIHAHLEARNIESRPVWKPMHLQPVFEGCRSIGGRVSEGLFARGLCLPSGSSMTKSDLSRVVDAVLNAITH